MSDLSGEFMAPPKTSEPKVQKIDYPEFVRCLDETYIKILTGAMSQLPDIEQAVVQ